MSQYLLWLLKTLHWLERRREIHLMLECEWGSECFNHKVVYLCWCVSHLLLPSSLIVRIHIHFLNLLNATYNTSLLPLFVSVCTPLPARRGLLVRSGGWMSAGYLVLNKLMCQSDSPAGRLLSPQPEDMCLKTSLNVHYSCVYLVIYCTSVWLWFIFLEKK